MDQGDGLCESGQWVATAGAGLRSLYLELCRGDRQCLFGNHREDEVENVARRPRAGHRAAIRADAVTSQSASMSILAA